MGGAPGGIRRLRSSGSAFAARGAAEAAEADLSCRRRARWTDSICRSTGGDRNGQARRWRQHGPVVWPRLHDIRFAWSRFGDDLDPSRRPRIPAEHVGPHCEVLSRPSAGVVICQRAARGRAAHRRLRAPTPCGYRLSRSAAGDNARNIQRYRHRNRRNT